MEFIEDLTSQSLAPTCAQVGKRVAGIFLQIAFFLKVVKMAIRETAGHYVWWTRGDSRVRSAHTYRDGRVFNWNRPPKGGHPGEDYGCRCRAALMTSEEQLPPEFQNPDNPLRYTDLVKSGLLNKFNKMVKDNNKFKEADNERLVQKLKLKAGERIPVMVVNTALAKRVKTRRDAKRSAGEFQEALQIKATLVADNRPLEDKGPQGKNKSVAGQTAIDILKDFIINLARTAVDLLFPIVPFSLVNPEAFKGLDQAIKGVLEQYEEHGRLIGEWGEENPHYNFLIAKLFPKNKGEMDPRQFRIK